MRAQNESSYKSDYSNTQSAKLIPPAPYAYSAEGITPTSFAVNFSSLYALNHVDVATDADFKNLVYYNQDVPAGLSDATIVGLQPSTVYYARMRAVSPAGDVSPYSVTVSAQTLPVPPADLTVTNLTPIGFTASWQPTPGATHYWLEVARRQPNFDPAYYNYSKFDAGNSTSFDVKGVYVGNYYYLRVVALNGATGTLSYSGIQYTLIPDTFDPSLASAQDAADEDLFSIYPNPGTGRFQVTLHLPASESGDKVAIRVLNASGETVRLVERPANTPTESIDLSNQPPGIYNVQLSYRGRLINKRIVKI